MVMSSAFVFFLSLCGFQVKAKASSRALLSLVILHLVASFLLSFNKIQFYLYSVTTKVIIQHVITDQ